MRALVSVDEEIMSDAKLDAAVTDLDTSCDILLFTYSILPFPGVVVVAAVVSVPVFSVSVISDAGTFNAESDSCTTWCASD